MFPLTENAHLGVYPNKIFLIHVFHLCYIFSSSSKLEANEENFSSEAM